MQLSCLGKVETTAGPAGDTSEANRETERIKKDLADAKSEAVSLSEAVRKLEEQLKQPGEPSRAMVAVPLATQLSEALRAETASRKEIVDLESLLLHAEEGLKTQPASTNVQYEVKFAKEELAIAKTRQTLWVEQVRRLQEQAGGPSANATTRVQAFLAAALAGKVDEAAALADGDQFPVEQIRELRDQIKGPRR